MSLSDFFKINEIKYIYSIHLERDKDRYDGMIENLKYTNLDYEIIDAIDGNKINHHRKGRGKNPNGMIGCYLSHEKALQRAIDNDKFPCLIIEDDCMLKVPNPNVDLNLKLPKHIVNLGSREFKIGSKANYWKNLPKETNILVELKKDIWTYCASCIFYPNKDECIKLLDYLKNQKSIYHLDGIIFTKYSIIEKVYATNPNIFITEENISNNTKKIRKRLKYL